MNPTLLEDYIEILEAEDFLDGTHREYLKMAKKDLAEAKEEAFDEMNDNRIEDNKMYKHPVKDLDLDRVDYEFALISNK